MLKRHRPFEDAQRFYRDLFALASRYFN